LSFELDDTIACLEVLDGSPTLSMRLPDSLKGVFLSKKPVFGL
jgi:hypothetical protein